MELNRKLITVILVILIIVVPIGAYLYIVYGPASLDSITIDSVAPDYEKRDGVRIIATAQGSGRGFSGDMNLQVYFESERVYAGKIGFTDGFANHKLDFSDFSKGNGEYQFRLNYEDLSDRYDFELDVVAEELGVVSTQTYGLEGSGHQPWEALYSYNVVFRTGWHFFTHRIDTDEFASYELGYLSTDDVSVPLKVRTDKDGCQVEVYFTNQVGVQSRIHQFDVPAGDTFETTIEINVNGSYLYKYINGKTVPIEIEAYENRPVDKLPSGGNIVVTQALGGQTKEDTQLITMIDQVSGFVRPQYGPGNYTMTIDYPNPQVMEGDAKSTISFTEVIELNDKPRAIGKATPGQLTTLQRTITFSAVDSFDDGPKADLYVIWSMGLTSDEEEIDSFEGSWDDMKEITYTYAFGEDPDVSKGKPYVILRDAYGAFSAKYEINLSVG